MTKVLLAVDDSVTMRKAYELTFAGEEFQVITADSAESALREVSVQPAVILIDTYLDPADGYELARELRKRSPSSAMVLLTSRHHPFDEARGRDLQAEEAIDKPFDTQLLIDRVRGAIAKRAQAPAKPATYSDPPTVSRTPAPAVVTMPPTQATPPRPPPLRPIAEAISVVPAPPSSPPAMTGALLNQNGLGAGSDFEGKLLGLGLTGEQVRAVLALSRDVVERVVWEVVPPLAETMIREEITRLTADR